MNAERGYVTIQFNAICIYCIPTLWVETVTGPGETDMKLHDLCLYIMYNFMRKEGRYKAMNKLQNAIRATMEASKR